MKPTARQINKAIRLENETFERQQAVAARKIAKLKSLTVERGATPAEAESAQAKADALLNKPKPRSRYAPPPLPQTVEELIAGRKGRPKATPRESVDDEVTQLKAEFARLKVEVTRLKAEHAKPSPGRPGRKPIGDRAMTAAERMRRMRSR